MTLKRKILTMFTTFAILMFAGTWIIFRSLTMEQLTEQSRSNLADFALILGRQFESSGIESFEKHIETSDGLRVTLIELSGKVLFDSEENAEQMDNHLNRPEIKEAFTTANGEGSSLRYSDTLNLWFNYYALKLNNNMVIRIASPIQRMNIIFSKSRAKFYIWVAPAFLMLSFIWIWLTKRLFIPIESIIKSADNIHLNENSVHLPKFPLMGDPEMQRLGNSLNDMGERLNNALIDIRRRREELSQIVEALPVGVVLTDSLHKIRYVNTIAKKLLGGTPFVKKGSIVDQILPNREIIDMLDSEDKSKDFYLPLKNTYVNIGSLGVSGGKLLVIRDLTVEKNVEEMRRNFIIDASHEFQTPLTVIRMAAELLLSDETKISIVSKNNLGKIIRQQERLTELVDELLLLTNTDNAAMQENCEEMNLGEIIAGITDGIVTNPYADKTKIEVAISPENAPFPGRKQEIKRALSNVIENAFKYSKDALNPHVKISLSMESNAGSSCYRITVEDNGPGISDEKAIFEPFRRGDSSRSRKGTNSNGGLGLGLSIAKRIIESHGGSISVEKTDLGGAAFVILLNSNV